MGKKKKVGAYIQSDYAGCMKKVPTKKKLSSEEAAKSRAKWNVQDWAKPKQYDYVKRLKENQLRWEFLRRDDNYRTDWLLGKPYGHGKYELDAWHDPAQESTPKFMPDLRIVPQALWDSVQARLLDIRQRSTKIRESLNNPNSRSRSGKYLFSGLLQCGSCGANYTVYSTTSYGCSTNINRGDAACSNNLRVSRKVLEENLLDIIRKDLLSDEAIELFLSAFTDELQNRQAANQPSLAVQKQRLVDAEREIANIMKAISAGIITATTKEALEKAEWAQDQAKLALQAHTRNVEPVLITLPNIIERYRANIGNLGHTLYADVMQARECLKGLLGTIRLLPTPEGLKAELRHNIDGLLGLASGNDLKARMVAGARFELTTFRL